MKNFDQLTTKEKHEAIASTHIDTKAETTFAELLSASGETFKSEVIIGKYRIDFLLSGSQIIEVNGGYHNTTKQRKKDKSRATYLLKRGYEIKEISNDDVFRCQKKEISLEKLLEPDNRSIKERYEISHIH